MDIIVSTNQESKIVTDYKIKAPFKGALTIKCDIR